MSGFDHPDAAPRVLGAVTIVLSGAAGALDAVTFFAFNEVFASTMTGNLVLLGLDIGRGRWLQTIEALSAIGGYVGGLVIGTVVAGLVMRRLPWRNAVGVALTVELALLIAVGIGYYGFTAPDLETARAVLLVVGSGLAMGIQAAAMRYVGATGTPTNFLTGTVTNWVSAMVELHRPRWDGNSAVRIVALAAAAALGAVTQVHAPAFTYALPVGLVLVGVALMGAVTAANHGGLTRGRPQFVDLGAMVDRYDPFDSTRGGDVVAGADGRTVVGRVVDRGGAPLDAALTLLDSDGRFVSRETTGADGRYRLRTSLPGIYTVICSPIVLTDAGPTTSTIVLRHGPVVHDVTVDAESGDGGGIDARTTDR